MGLTSFFKKSDKDQQSPNQMLASEILVRHNTAFMREYCRKILEERGLPLALAAYDYFIELNEGKMRKDDITPSEQHEQLHILMADALLKSEKNKLGWDTKKFGGEDAFFTAIIFHDVIEDRGHTDTNLRRFLENAIEELFEKEKHGFGKHMQLYREAGHAVKKVCILSRNWPHGDKGKLSRYEYMDRLTEDPAAILIKMIDWANKEATMIGVDHFEKNNREKMRKNIEETDEYFGDVRLALPRTVAAKHPKIGKKVDKLDAIMAILHHSLKGYVFASDNYREEHNTARSGRAYDFSRWTGLAKSVLRHLPDGANLVKIQMNRIIQAGENDPSIRAYYTITLRPAVAALMAPVPSWSLMRPFSKAATCTHTALEALLERPQRIL